MKSRNHGAQALVMAVLLAASAAANATVTVYTTQASFLAAVSASATDTFDGEPQGGPVFPYVGTAGPYGYFADAPFDGMYILANSADHWLSTNSPNDPITFYGLPTEVRGIGAQFFATNFDGGVLPGLEVQFAAQDSSGTTLFTLTSSDISTFVGFVSDGAWSSLVVTAVAPANGEVFTTVNNLTLGTAAVPEPASWAMLLGGLALVAARSRRRGG